MPWPWPATCTPSWSIVTGTPPIVAEATDTAALYDGVPSFVIEAVTWMPLITIWPPPRLTRPTLDSPLVTNVPPGVVSALALPLFALLLLPPFDVVAPVFAFAFLLVASSVARVDEVSSDRPSAGGGSEADAEASDRDDAGADDRCDGNGAGGVVTVGVGVTGRGVVTVATGVVTVAAGAVTLGFGTVTPGFGTVTVPTGVETGGTALRRPRRPPHVAFQPASA